jgi:hypothetical protein
MYITTSHFAEDPGIRASLCPRLDGGEPRMHLAFGSDLAVIMELADLRKLAQVIEDAFVLAMGDDLDARA